MTRIGLTTLPLFVDAAGGVDLRFVSVAVQQVVAGEAWGCAIAEALIFFAAVRVEWSPLVGGLSECLKYPEALHVRGSCEGVGCVNAWPTVEFCWRHQCSIVDCVATTATSDASTVLSY